MSMRRKPVVIAGLLVSMLLPVIFYKDIGTAYVAYRFTTAKDSDAELAAARLINSSANRWTHGYSVTAKDAKGNDLRLLESGDYGAVKAVNVTWHNGTSAYRDIKNSSTLSYVFGE